MFIDDEKYSDNFWAKEFNYIEPETSLLRVLERLRAITGESIAITSAAREVADHIRIYKELESEGKLGGKKWHEAIPRGSRHLPSFTKKLRAVDFKAKKGNSFYSGEELLSLLSDIEKEFGIMLGIGVGSTFCHLDVDRKRSAVWHYSY